MPGSSVLATDEGFFDVHGLTSHVSHFHEKPEGKHHCYCYCRSLAAPALEWIL